VEEGTVSLLLHRPGAADGFLGRNTGKDQLRGVRRTGAPSAA